MGELPTSYRDTTTKTTKRWDGHYGVIVSTVVGSKVTKAVPFYVTRRMKHSSLLYLVCYGYTLWAGLYPIRTPRSSVNVVVLLMGASLSVDCRTLSAAHFPVRCQRCRASAGGVCQRGLWDTACRAPLDRYQRCRTSAGGVCQLGLWDTACRTSP